MNTHKELQFKFFYWIETSIIDFFIFDAWWFPTDLITDFVTPRITKYVHSKILTRFLGERVEAYDTFVQSHSIPKIYYAVSAAITGLLELDFTAILNNTIGAIINPAGIDFWVSLFRAFLTAKTTKNAKKS